MLIVVGSILSPTTWAQDTGWYGGFGIGQSRATIDEQGITAGLLDNGFTVDSFTDDDRDLGFKIYGGYKLSRYFALEGGYFNLGKFTFEADTTPAGTYNGSIKTQGLNLDALGIIPFTERFSAFGLVGVNYARSKDVFSGTGFIDVIEPDFKKSDINIKYGLGLQFAITDALSIRTQAERYRINDAYDSNGDIDLYSVGLVFKFGGSQAPAKRVVERAKPVMVMVPEPVASRNQRYCSILDIQFEINVDNLQRDDQEKLGVVGTFMNKYNDTTALIEGHTDNVGSPAQNLTLSKRRAESVVSYLMTNFNIRASRLKAVGYGETRPIADNSTESGKRQNRRINAVIACATDIEGLTVAPARVTMALEMEFDTNKADVRSQYRDELQKVADFMKANPGVVATVEGHTSNQGGVPAEDMQLSQRRAESVVNYLVNQFGADRASLFAAGFGHTRRTAYNTTAEGQQENRRVNIIFDFPNR